MTFKATDDLDDIDADTALCLYRVAQEALNNVIKHARAETAMVELKWTTGDVALDITDDGIGFVVPTVAPRASGCAAWKSG